MVGTRVGYTGGTKPNPTYKSVCKGDGHTEAIQIKYDPLKTDYNALLDAFWQQHSGTSTAKCQYKSAIWYHDEEQRQLAEQKKKEVTRLRGTNVVTEILPATTWYDAEEYHQQYISKQS